MKLAKLSLAAMVVAGLATSSFAADTLADAFAKGKVSGELKAWYFDRDFEKPYGGTTFKENSSADIFNVGLVLGYVTDSFYGFSMGATVQTNHAPFADTDAKLKADPTTSNDLNSGFASDQYGSGAQLSEAYIAYKMKNTTVKVGRQFIATPLVAGSGSRMIKQSFEAAMITNTDIPNTTLAAGVVTKYQDRTDGLGGVAQFNELNKAHDYAYTVLAINKSIPGLTLTAQYASLANDDKETDLTKLAGFNDYYFEAAYAGKAGEISYGVAANYLYTDWKSWDASSMYGAKISLGMGDLNGYVAYTKIDDDSDKKGVKSGLGSGAQPAFAKGYQFTAGTYDADTDSYSIDVNYNFKSIGLLTGARYTAASWGNNASSTLAAFGKDRSYTDIYAVYNFTGALKGLTADVSYEDMGKDLDGQELWFKANYKF